MPAEHYCQSKMSQNPCWHPCSGLHDLVVQCSLCGVQSSYSCKFVGSPPDVLAAVGNDLHLLVLGHAEPCAQLPPRLCIQGQPLVPLLQPQHLLVSAPSQGNSNIVKHWHGVCTQQPPCPCPLGQPLVSRVCSVQPARVQVPGHTKSSGSQPFANSKSCMSYHMIHWANGTCWAAQLLHL